ncbi:protein transport protein Sec31A isoform X2 [Sitodiplosis mosellana]|uniref:protein transport protein Sec31A isoform X2 n=1 Tax=Sitodiplosis mosellana TaxID=263140 RepID=UPI0024448A40|nr:protein transport protein Sec31A isoform X2 [Sitodiplosis mosellana]XP_055317144.1 protein transport protein Sec31A isoform X2 [Sitodiplosis mosellana]XP_055317145.1 protein transport protein Sec31A isoform X2 [Sitodiplosis mosellana]XP_055317146.1 protein transport protein Sec31A isoform X2 [Sitodiplosis mosellana]XP_055317147.1 protein transport protein Sec31A isoform X2 [Sitodiplosis mosellana]XP_055317148.1 protein transport protein Sec31A isoform X2 [Sitodiplosis mosellana]XP_05531714
MKIKELQKTVNIAWSPAQLNQLYLAAGTAAQQIDTSLNSNATLEIYETNLTDPGYDLNLKASQNSPYRFQKIVWSPLRNQGNTCGIIAAGCESGHLQLYSASKLLAGEDALVASQDKHTGAVRALDYNPFQVNLLASGASESDIFIWDLNNTTTPMTPGTKTQPLEDIQNIGWNRQVQHILASVFSTRCVVWDLRKNEPIIKLSDTQSRVRFRALQWHPTIATQLWLASEDDQAPFVQLWDLRYATAPAKTLKIHDRGILGLTWCLKDTDLMVSCGKDNKILCWNPNGEPGDECISEIATPLQWYSDVIWCPRNPALIASSSLDGAVSIYSLYGGTQHQVQTSNKIADSFPGMEHFAQAPTPQATTQIVYNDLKKPPKWMKRPVGAKFGFGGKLITFRNEPSAPHTINISQVTTEPELVERSTKLEEVLSNGNFIDYCKQRADETEDQHSRYVWYFLKANFEADPHAEMLNLLGYNIEDMRGKFNKYIEKNADNDIDAINTRLADLGQDNAAIFDNLASQQKLKDDLDSSNEEIPYKIRTGDDNEGLICQALLTGNIESAVELCIDSDRMADAIIIATTGGSDLLARTQYRYLKKSQGFLSNIISALVTDDWSSVISQCTADSWKEALVATLTYCREHVPVLCERLGERLQCESGSNLASIQNAILCYICAGNAERLAESWLAAQSTTANGESVPSTQELQDLIEVVILFQKALELQGRNVNATGKLAELLSQYAGLLASQGALNSALTYLGPSEAADIVELRERLYYTLGHKQAYATNVRSQSQAQNMYVKAQTPNKFGQRPSNGSIQSPLTATFNNSYNNNSFSNNSYSNSFPAAAPTTASPPTWGQPVPSHPQAQPWNSTPFAPSNVAQPNPILPPVQSKPPPTQPPLFDPSAQPPRPSSVSSQGTAPVARSKYVLDPSVQSSSSYGQAPGLYASQNQTFGSQQPSYGSQFNQPFNQPVSNPVPIASIGQSSILNPQPINTFAPGLPPIEVAQPAIQQNIQRNPTPPPGWNDPPALKSTRLPPAVQPTETNANVITHPLFGVDPNQNQNGYGDLSGGQFVTSPNASYQGTYMTPQLPPQQQQQPAHQLPSTGFPPQTQTFQTQLPNAQPLQFSQSAQQPFANSEPIKQKPPLPEEYIYMQTVFNELRTQCCNVTNNPQTKRKLDDVSKRLEQLYDLLRENRLTPNTLGSLNQLTQLVQIGDYANGLGLHTQMVSGPDFSQIAGFMPGIKVLLQTAMQLQVCLR